MKELRQKIKRKLRAMKRRMQALTKAPSIMPPRRTFAFTCVKKPEYVRMAIDNINSLLYLNDSYSFIIYADTICSAEFERLKSRLDYKDRVICNNVFGETREPWQKYKVETIIDASRKGYTFTDADGIWHDEPIIDSSKITILVLARAISDDPVEKKVAETLFATEGAVNFNHYVSGFLSIPPAMMTGGLADDMRRFTGILLYDPLSFLKEERDRRNIHRVAEELGVNIALQKHHKAIETLKKDDGPKSRSSLQSLYYGCNNDIIT